MLIDAVKCLNCGAIVFSRVNHDFRECPCGGIFVDGGYTTEEGHLSYGRFGGVAINSNSKQMTIEIEQDIDELYDDWNNYRNQFGILYEAPKVFLGGTCAESTWREDLIQNITIDFFNPVVEDWTPECQEEEFKQRKECDICLYVITCKMHGVYSIAEVIDDCNKRSMKTVFCFIEDGFDYGQVKSLDMVGKMVEDNGAVWVRDFNELAKTLNDWRHDV